jgi:hypothetical protein
MTCHESIYVYNNHNFINYDFTCMYAHMNIWVCIKGKAIPVTGCEDP